MASKFQEHQLYRSLCDIHTPHGVIEKGTVLWSEQWVKYLVFEVGDASFGRMFELVDEMEEKK